MHLVMSRMKTFSGKRPHFISRSQRLMHPYSYQQPSFAVLHIFALKQRNIEILLFFPLVVEVLFWRCGLPNTGEALWNMCTTCNLVGRTMNMVLVLLAGGYTCQISKGMCWTFAAFTKSWTSAWIRLDPVGSTVRYEVMKLCTGSVEDSNGRYIVVLSQ